MHEFSFLLGKDLAVGLLNHMVNVCSTSEETAQLFSRTLLLSLVGKKKRGCSKGCVVIKYCGFNLKFAND